MKWQRSLFLLLVLFSLIVLHFLGVDSFPKWLHAIKGDVNDLLLVLDV